jgi:hypothetical protein
MNPIMDGALAAGMLLLAAGTMLGVPHGLSKRRGDLVRTELWRVAHLSTCLGGIALMGLVFAAERLVPDRAAFVVIPFVVAAVLFFTACSLSGVIGQGWDGDRTRTPVRVVYTLQIVASAASVAGVAAIVFSLAERCFR